jgi:putative flippase GtrA
LGPYLKERGKARMALPVAGMYTRYRHLIPELLKFAVVGGIGSVIDLGGAALLHGKFHVEGLEAKAISTTLATVFTYLGSRFWTFKHRENQALGREAALFVALNLIGLLIAEVVIALTVYGFGLHSQLEYNAASVLGTGLATIFRYFAYRQWVFTAPAGEPSALTTPEPELAPFPEFSPWEADPAFLAAEVMAPAHASVASGGWDSPDPSPAPAWPSDPAPSWESSGGQPSWDAPNADRSWGTASQVSPWGRAGEPTQPWVDSSIISNARVASSSRPASDTSGQGLIDSGQVLMGGSDQADSAARGQGRHRRS